MRVRFWGTRGSIATPGPDTAGYGGNTSCVEVRAGGEVLVFDAGTGIRPLGLALMEEFGTRPFSVHLFISHAHWDHIQGFPFFMPAYARSVSLHVYGASGPRRSLEMLLRGLMDTDYFPVALGDLDASLATHEFRGDDFQVGDVTVSGCYLNHPGMALGYRVRHAGKTVVYATDHEPYRSTLPALGGRGEAGRRYGAELDTELIRFVEGADLYIGEAQYTDEEYPTKVGWGHSPLSATVGVALAAGAGALALFHHDPMHADEVVTAMVARARELVAGQGGRLTCFAAREGETLDV
jgi:phosphoribosyl 1,2-cyclic phosphodiesterase